MTHGTGAVAAGHPETTAAAVATLGAGGNAFDAAVAAGFASAVSEPALTSLGGGGFLLARTGAGHERLFDFFVDTPGRGLPARELEPHFFPVTVRFPASEQDFNVGLGSVAVPGALRGYLHVHAELGRLELARVLAPAVRLARDGVRLDERQSYFLGLLEPILTHTERGRRIFAPGGRLLRRGERFCNPELADFLEALPEDHGRSFYAGELAGRIAEEMDAGQGLLTHQDLAAYAVVEREPLACEYRGQRFLTNPPPAFGGSLTALSFALLATHELRGSGWGSAEHLRALVSVMEEVDRLRESGCLSPQALSDGALGEAAGRIRLFSRGTTHVSVADAEGNVASMTTSNGEGSGYLAPGTGILLNNMLGEDDLHPEGFHASPPGERVASMMSPSLLLRDGRVALVVGSGGSKRIRTALLQVVSNRVDFGLAVADAVEAPRLHWDGACVQAEPGFPDAGIAALRARRPLNQWPVRDVYFGGVHAVQPGAPGQAAAAGADSRRGGHAALVP